MKRKHFKEEQIVGILKEHKVGVSVLDLCPKNGVAMPASISGKLSTRPGGF
jgi:hypothetical protein